MTDYKKEFIAESLEILAILEKNLLILEEIPDDHHVMEELLRGLHTLKGASGMYGFEKIGKLMHSVENIFENTRSKQNTINKDIINLTLEAIDFSIQVFNSNEDVNSSNKKKFESLINKIENFLQSSSDNQFESPSDKQQNACTYYITFTIDPGFESRGVKLDGIFKELNELGTVVSIPIQEDAPDTVTWEIFIVSDNKIHELEDILIFMLDIASIKLLANQNLFLNDQFKSVVQTNSSLKTKNNLDELMKLIQTIKQETDTDKVIVDNRSANTSKLNKDFLRVAADKLDEQMDLLSELVTAKAELRLIVENEKYTKLYRLVEAMDKVTNSFRKNILNTRLVQVKSWYVLFLRLVRDTSSQLNKKVEFIAEGLETEIDKNIIDSLEAPLTHLIRNSLDHGIETPEERIKNGKPETAFVKLKASHSGSNILIEISDDGRGLQKEAILQKAISKGIIERDADLTDKQIFDLIFLQGFSTAKNLSEVSGRGVGMDVVNKAIGQLRGEIEVQSTEGKGTNILIRLPMMLSIIDTLLIRSEQQFFAIPLHEVHKCTQINSADQEYSNNNQLKIEGELIPYINLRKVFNISKTAPDKQKLILIKNGNKKIGLITDEVIGEYQAVLKPFDGYYINKQYFIGASLLADGNLCVILDTSKLLSDL